MRSYEDARQELNRLEIWLAERNESAAASLRNSRMAQRWLATVALYAEEGFRAVKGFQFIPEVVGRIKARQAGQQALKQAA